MRVENPKEEALLLWLATPNFEGGFWLDVYILPWDSHLFKIMCNSVGAAQCRKLWYRKRISLVVWPWNLCSRACTMPYLSSVVPAPRSTATMGHYLVKMYQNMELEGFFFLKNHPIIRVSFIGRPWAPSLCWASRDGDLQTVGKRLQTDETCSNRRMCRLCLAYPRPGNTTITFLSQIPNLCKFCFHPNTVGWYDRTISILQSLGLSTFQAWNVSRHVILSSLLVF